MKTIIWRSVFGISNLFFLLGIAPILKGDVDGHDEIIFMGAYLSLFAAIMLIAKSQLLKNQFKDNARHKPVGGGFGAR